MTITGTQLQEVARQVASALPDVMCGYPFTPALVVYKVREKVFLIVTEDPAEQIITVKAEPNHGAALRRSFATITPGRYLHKQHWITIGAGVGITPALVEDLVANSYELVVSRMPHYDQPTDALGAAQTHERPNATPQATSVSDGESSPGS